MDKLNLARYHSIKMTKLIALLMLMISSFLVSLPASNAEAAGIRTAMTRVCFTQPHCQPDFDDSWYVQIAKQVNDRLESHSVYGTSETDVWREFVECNDFSGKTLERAKVNRSFKEFIKERYDVCVNVDVSKYVTYQNGLTSVAVQLSIKDTNGVVLKSVADSKTNVPGTNREVVLEGIIESLMTRLEANVL